MPVGEAVEMGGTLSVEPGQKLELVADVQAPDWVQFDRIEVYTHTTGREATNGESNGEWPDSRILARKVLDPANLTIEPVPGPGNARRVHETARFVLSPSADTWYVVMVRAVNSNRSLMPLTGARPFAVANAILVDADRSGAYDDFPLKGQPLTAAPKPPAPVGPRRVPTLEEFARALERVLHCGHESP
jgi:hypothetical protein